MGAEDFGWFLVGLGVVFLLFSTPMNLSSLRNPFVFPVGLIFFGCFELLTGFLDVHWLRKVRGLLFAVFIILLVKAYAWDIPFMVSSVNPSSLVDSFNASAPVLIDCPVCDVFLGGFGLSVVYDSSNTELNFSSDSLIINALNPSSFSVINYSLPVSAVVDLGVGDLSGSITGLHEFVNLSLGVGSARLSLDNASVESFRLSSGVGSLVVVVNSLSDASELSLETGVGSIELFINESLPFRLIPSVGLGSVSNEFDSLVSPGLNDSATSLMAHLSAGLGSVSIRKL